MTNSAQIAPPNAPELEQAVLGAVLIDPDALVLVMGFLRAEHFYNPSHRSIYGACEALFSAGPPAELLTVVQQLRKMGELAAAGGPQYLAELTNKVASGANVEVHARIVMQEWARREVMRIGKEAAAKAQDEREDVFDAMDATEAAYMAIQQAVSIKAGESIAELATEFLRDLDKPKPQRHSTGLRDLDKALGGGWSGGDLILIAGRPAMGKTSAAFSMVYNSAQAGHASGLFSLELGREKTNARLVSIGTGIPVPVILAGGYGVDNLKRIHEHHVSYVKMPVQVNFATGIGIAELRSEVSRMKKAASITALFIDQLNWIRAPKGEKDPVGAVTRALKNIAMEHNIPVVCLHQLSRAVETRGGDKRPQLTDLRDSGAAEQDAQVVIFVHRPEYYGVTDDNEGSTVGRADLIIAKNSNGPTGSVRVRFDAHCARFRDNDFEPPEFAQPVPTPQPVEADEDLPF
jgi:replicative DNA helicase